MSSVGDFPIRLRAANAARRVLRLRRASGAHCTPNPHVRHGWGLISGGDAHCHVPGEGDSGLLGGERRESGSDKPSNLGRSSAGISPLFIYQIALPVTLIPPSTDTLASSPRCIYLLYSFYWLRCFVQRTLRWKCLENQMMVSEARILRAAVA